MVTPNLHTVNGLVIAVRNKLLDLIQPYRYSDTAIIAGINLALLEGRRVRADIFICKYQIKVPQYEEPSGDELPFDAQFRVAFEFGAAAYVLWNDAEDVPDERANTFDTRFHDILEGKRPGPVTGGTPAPAAKGAQ